MIRLVPPQKHWHELFKKEEKLLRAVLNGHVIALEHIGSTSRGDIWTKNIVDIAVLLPSTPLIEEYRLRFETVGYTWLGHGTHSDTGRRVLSRTENGNTVARIHLFPLGHEGFYAVVRFRDMLCRDRNLAERYERLKRDLLEKVNGNPELYHEGKTSFILGCLEQPKEEL